ncbi:MAG: carbohydrate porin [Chthoniobacterales bacterium]
MPQRAKDITMFGLAYGNFSDDYGHAGPAYQVQPNVPYVIQPGGTGAIPNALVFGAQIGVTF